MGISILLVDDNEGDLAILSRAFAEAGQNISITACSNAPDALEWVERQDEADTGATLVVTDLNMPGTDGFEFMHRLRNNPKCPPVVIVLSTSSRAADVQRAYESGANAYHAKPMGYAETTALCQEIVDYWTTAAYLPAKSPAVSSLLYVSKAVDEFSDEDLEDLEMKAALTNRVHAVSGFLTYNDGHFFQYIEGPRDGLDAAYLRIKTDQRHEIMREVSLGRARRRFARWGMSVMDPTRSSERPLDELARDSIQALIENRLGTGNGPVADLLRRMETAHQWSEYRNA